MSDNTVAPVPPAQTVVLSGRYVVIVGGLMLLIIALLASLWARERSARGKAEKFIEELQASRQNDQQSMAQAMLSQMAGRGGEGPGVRPFQRQDHVPTPVTLDGVKRQAYRLRADGAARFGFAPGDVIIVEAEAKTPSPATGPASPSETNASSPAGE